MSEIFENSVKKIFLDKLGLQLLVMSFFIAIFRFSWDKSLQDFTAKFN